MQNLNNSIRLEGFAAEKVETRTVGSTNVTSIQIATNSSRKNKTTGEYDNFTEWHTVEAWGKTGDYVAKKCRKGSLVKLEGKLEYNTYEKTYGEGKAAQTVKHTRAIVRVNNIQIINRKGGEEE